MTAVMQSAVLPPGIHYDIPPDRYRRDDLTDTPALTASTIINLIQMGPARAWVAKHRDRTPKKACEFGTAAHIAFLEHNRWSSAIAIMAEENYKLGKTQDARDEARANGQTPLLPRDVAKLDDMAKAMRNELPGLPFDTAAPFLGDIFSGGHSEVTAIAAGDPMLKIRPDYVHVGDDYDVLVDFKTTSYSADQIARQARAARWDIIAEFYMMVWERATGRPAHYLFVHQNTEWPHFVHHSLIDTEDLSIAAAEIESATQVFRECMASGVWQSDVMDPRIIQMNRKYDALGS